MRFLPAAGLAALIALATAPAACPAHRARPDRAPLSVPEPLAGVRRIVALGDSITEQGGQPGGYVWLLQQYLARLYPEQHVEVVNAGISGQKSTDMAARFQGDVLDRRPDLATISVGVNDVWHGFYDDHPLGDGPKGVPLPVYREKLAEMILAAKAAGVRVVLLAPTVIHENLSNRENARLAAYVAAMRDLAREHGCRFVDLNAAFRDALLAYQRHAGRRVNLLTTDGVHMNPAGNQLMAWTILRGLGVPERDLAGIGL